jgi:hypothetical protein
VKTTRFDGSGKPFAKSGFDDKKKEKKGGVMEEILPGVYHWTSFHEGIGEKVHSCYLPTLQPAILIDPRLPAEGISWFAARPPPRHVYLTNRHHYRHSAQFEQEFGSQVWCHRDGLHEFTRGERVFPFAHGDRLPGGIEARPVGVLCPEETALHIPLHGGMLAIGDAIVRYGEELAFVPDELLGEDPQAVKQGLKRAFSALLQQGDFEHLLFAHGQPSIGDGPAGLRRFLHSLPD